MSKQAFKVIKYGFSIIVLSSSIAALGNSLTNKGLEKLRVPHAGFICENMQCSAKGECPKGCGCNVPAGGENGDCAANQ